jgi:hypothetical protein
LTGRIHWAGEWKKSFQSYSSAEHSLANLSFAFLPSHLPCRIIILVAASRAVFLCGPKRAGGKMGLKIPGFSTHAVVHQRLAFAAFVACRENRAGAENILHFLC